MLVASNSCRFTGKLLDYTVRAVGDGSYTLGKGKIFLPDLENENVGQYISIVAWGEIAEARNLVASHTWISVIASYTPNVFKNKLYDTFTVNFFKTETDQ